MSEDKQLLTQIQEEQDVDKLKDLTNLFNIHQIKKNAIKAETLDDLQDKVISRLSERIEKRSDNFTNKELLDSLQVIQNVKEKSEQKVTSINESPAIAIQVNNNTNLNIDNESFDRESRQRIASAVEAILAKANQQSEIIDVKSEETAEETIV